MILWYYLMITLNVLLSSCEQFCTLFLNFIDVKITKILQDLYSNLLYKILESNFAVLDIICSINKQKIITLCFDYLCSSLEFRESSINVR